MGFHYVAQAGPKLLASSDPPASASQSTGILEAFYVMQSWPTKNLIMSTVLWQAP